MLSALRCSNTDAMPSFCSYSYSASNCSDYRSSPSRARRIHLTATQLARSDETPPNYTLARTRRLHVLPLSPRPAPNTAPLLCAFYLLVILRLHRTQSTLLLSHHGWLRAPAGAIGADHGSEAQVAVR